MPGWSGCGGHRRTETAEAGSGWGRIAKAVGFAVGENPQNPYEYQARLPAHGHE